MLFINGSWGLIMTNKRLFIIFFLIFASVIFIMNQKSIKDAENNEIQDQTPFEIKGLGSENSIKVGVYQPLSGSSSAGGIMELNGIEIANQIYSNINGIPIELVIRDNESKKSKSVNVVTDLIENYKVKAILGSWGSDYAIAAAPIIESYKIPTIGASCSSPQVTMGNEYYSRVCNIDSIQAKAMAKFVISNYKAKKIAIVIDNSSQYSKGLSEYFRESFFDMNGLKSATTKEYYFKSGDISFKKQINAIKLMEADVVYVASNYLDGIQFIKDARDNKLTIPILGPDTWDTPEFILRGGPAVESVIFSSFYSQLQSTSHELARFRKEYMEKYNEEPASFAVLGYDAYLLLYYSIKKAESVESTILNRTIQSTKDFDGAVGPMTIDKNGDATRPIFIKQVEKSEFKTLNVFEHKE